MNQCTVETLTPVQPFSLRDLREAVAKLRQVTGHSPKKVQVLVDGSLGRTELGWCTRVSPGRYTIRVTPELTRSHLYDALIHEWAHVVHWEQGDAAADQDNHGAAWGLAWARVYRQVYGVT